MPQCGIIFGLLTYKYKQKPSGWNLPYSNGKRYNGDFYTMIEQHYTVQDPVCSMDINPKSAHPVYVFKGRIYHFCAENCRSAFAKNPEKYLKPKGFFARFLDRMAKSNKKAFGCKGPSCH